MRVIKTTSWKEFCEKHDIPFFHITEFHKIPDGIKCVLITGDNTFTHDGNIIKCGSYGKRKMPYISDVKFPDSLIFSTNASIWHPNVIPIPMGVLDFDDQIVKRDSFGIHKKIVCYANFNDWCGRDEVMNKIQDQDYITWRRYEGEDAHERYRQDLCDSNFVVSPFGNGYDCYRTWEAIYCGAIPIVPRCVLYERFKMLPIIMLDDWSNLTIDIIQKKYDDLKARGGAYDEVDLDYWEQRIIEA